MKEKIDDSLNKKYFIVLGTVVFSAIVFLVVDYFLPLGIAVGMLYIVTVFLSFNSPKVKLIYIAGAISVIFVTAGYFITFITPETFQMSLNNIAVINRALSLVAILVTTFLGINRKKAEQRLAGSEERNKQILNTAVDGILTIDAFGIVQSLNPAASKLFAYPPEEVIGRNISMLMPNPYSREHDGYLGNYRKTGVKKIIGVGREIIGLRKDGSTFPGHLSVSEFTMNGATFFTGLVRDITELKKAEEEIKTTNINLSRQTWISSGQVKLQEAVKGNIGLEDLAGKAVSEIAQYTGAQVGVFYLVTNNKLKMLAGHFYPKEVRVEFAFNEGLVGGVAVEKQLNKLSRADENMVLNSSVGKIMPKEIVALPILFDQETIAVIELAYVEKVEDKVTDLLTSLIDSLGVSINSAIGREKVDELLKETQAQAEELQAQQQELRASNEELEQKSVELQAQQHEMERTNVELEEQRSALEEQKETLEKTNYQLNVVRKEVEKKAEDLERSGKYKSEFMANMSHELRTPLNSILILSKLLQENQKANLSSEQVENAKIINSSGQDLLNLINDILDLSKVEAGKLEINIEQIGIDTVAKNLEASFSAIAKNKGLNFSIIIDPNCPKYINSDPLRLEQILKNFLSNAIKFTEKGNIELSFELIGNKASQLNYKKLNAKTDLAISVKDSGIGIPLEKQNLIFEAFQQVDGTITRRFGGTGLGLTIARSLADKLGGEILVASEEGQGSTFTLCIPALTLSTEANKPIEPEHIKSKSNRTEYSIDDREDIKAGDKVVLIVDDDQIFAKALMRKCHEQQFKTVISRSANEAINDINQYHPTGVLLDINLPDQSGLVVLDQIKHDAKTKNIPIFTMSVDEYRKDSLKLGAIGFIDKIADVDNLETVLQNITEIRHKQVKQILILEDDDIQRKAMVELLSEKNIEIDSVSTCQEASEILAKKHFDCMILDLKLPDMSGFEFLAKIKNSQDLVVPPIIVYTGRDLSGEDQRKLEEYSESIIIKGAKSPDRLLNEVAMFLHKLDNEFSKDKQVQLEKSRHREEIFKGKKVLIVDDDIRNTYSLKQILQGKEMKLLMALNGKEALDELKNHPDLDMILMDIMMPEMNGYEAMEAIRKTHSKDKLPIIALTAKAMKGDRTRCIEAGANDYLAKPIDPDSLLSLMRVWMTSTSPVLSI